MEVRNLGESGLKVPVLTLGTMTFGGEGTFANVGAAQEDEARRQIDLCLDAGANLIDTADMYSSGRAEEIIGRAIAGRRDQVLISTKASFPMGPGTNDAGLSRKHLVDALDASLARLGTEYVDIFYLHAWDGSTPVEETLETLEDLRRAGKIRYAGCSNFMAWQMMKFLSAAERRGLPRLATTQIYYSLQERSVEQEILPACVDQGVGALIWSPLAGGLLSGKYRRDANPESGRHVDEDWSEPPVPDRAELYATIEVIISVAEDLDAKPSQVAIAWLLTRPAVSSVVIGARTTAQLEENLEAARLKLPLEALARLEAVSRPPMQYPRWHQLATVADRFSEADASVLGPLLADPPPDLAG